MAICTKGESFVNVADLIEKEVVKPVAAYEETHLINCGDDHHLKKKAHFYSQALKRQKQDTERQLSWMQGCIKDYKEGLPIYDTSCVLALKESEEEQRERVGDGLGQALNMVAPTLLLIKNIIGD